MKNSSKKYQKLDGNLRSNFSRSFSKHGLLIGNVSIVLVALVATTRPYFGQVVADARLEHLTDPWQFLINHFHIWDDSSGPGGPSQLFSPVVGLLEVILDAFRLPMWLIGRLVLAVYLSIAGIGALMAQRHIFKASNLNAFATGMLYAFNPYTSQNLLPSGLFVSYAVFPVLILITLKGLETSRSAKYSALFALVIFALGALNTAAVIYLITGTLLFVMIVNYSDKICSWKRFVSFFLKTGLSPVVTCSAAIFVLMSRQTVTKFNIGTTESFSIVSQSTSPMELIRGMGNWLSYFSFQNAQAKSAPELIKSKFWYGLTFVVPLFAFIALGSRYVKWRRIFVFLLVVSLILSGGAFNSKGSLIASGYQWAFENISQVRVFRSTIKAGSLLLLIIAFLAPLGSEKVAEKLASSRRGRLTWPGSNSSVYKYGFSIILMVASMAPILFLGPFPPDSSFKEIPGYWSDVFRFFDEQASTDRVLIVPGLSRTNYEWGFVNDNLFDSLLKPQALQVQTLTKTTSELSSMVREVDLEITRQNNNKSQILQMIKQVNAQWVIVQNDVRLDGVGIIDLREIPGLTLTGSFGEDETEFPVEIYKVEGTSADFGWSKEPPTIISGSAGTLEHLAEAGWLKNPLVDFAKLKPDMLEQMLNDGSNIVVSDGSQRRTLISSKRYRFSNILFENEKTLRPIATQKPDDTSSMTVRILDPDVPQDIYGNEVTLRVPVEITRLPDHFVNPISYVFGETFDEKNKTRLNREFVTIRDQSFVLSGIYRSTAAGGLPEYDRGTAAGGLPEDECVQIFEIDGVPYEVKLAKIADSKNRYDFQGCQVVRLPAGSHLLREETRLVGQIEMISLADAIAIKPATDFRAPIAHNRLSSDKYEIDSIPSKGYIFTNIPFDDHWKIANSGSSLRPFSANGNLSFAAEPSGEGRVELVYSGQAWYRLTLVLSLVGLLFNLLMVFPWKNRKSEQ